MKTEIYKCIAQPDNKGMHFTIGKEYEFDFESTFCKTHDDARLVCAFTNTEFYQKFRKVEQNNNNKEMKYKVTITHADATGQEDNKTFEDLELNQITNLLHLYNGSTILIEPMPEKKKVTVWFYLFIDGNADISVVSTTDYNYIKKWFDESNSKCSEIFSKEVEI